MEVKLTNEQIKEILDGAPDDATHIDDNGVYYRCQKANRVSIWREYTDHETTFVLSSCICIFGLRSLSDLAEILKLNIENEQLKAEIEQICNEEGDGVNDV